MDETRCCHSCVQGKKFAEIFFSLSQGWHGAWNEYMSLLTVTQFLQELVSLFLGPFFIVFLCRMSEYPAWYAFLKLLEWEEMMTVKSSLSSLTDVSATIRFSVLAICTCLVRVLNQNGAWFVGCSVTNISSSPRLIWWGVSSIHSGLLPSSGLSIYL